MDGQILRIILIPILDRFVYPRIKFPWSSNDKFHLNEISSEEVSLYVI